MKTHDILIPAIASLALVAANPASALTPAWNAPQSAQVGSSAGGIELAKMSHWAYQCRKYFGHHDLQRCYEMHGLNSNGQRVKGGL